MGLTDIPGQIATSLKYSLRSPRSFLLSLISAVVVLGVAFDLLYAFFYTRFYDAKDTHYGVAFWLGLCFFGAIVPLVGASITLVAAKLKFRRFPPDKFGIAIAPFEVTSIDPDTLGTATKLASLDEAMRQYFNAAKRACDAEHWLDDFEFRFLPAYVRFQGKQDAAGRLDSMGATLVIWGEILQQHDQPLKMNQNILGAKVDMRMAGPMELSHHGSFLAFWALCGAGFRLGDAGKRNEAVNMFALAKKGPASALDELKHDPKQPHYFADMIDHFIQEYGGKPELPQDLSG
jgi:hypothetical protein